MWYHSWGQVIMYSCTDDVAAPQVSTVPVFSVETAPGIVATSSAMDALLTRTARSLALALGHSDALREKVRAAVASSEFPEGKLEFKTLIDDPAFGLRQAIANAAGTSPSRVRSGLDSIVGLELYLPVDAHRESWTGGHDLIVASLFRDDPGYSISAFDLEGKKVHLAMDEVPDRPLLSLVPAETDFSRAGTRQAASAAMAPDAGYQAFSGRTSAISGVDGIYMTYSYLPDLHEPVLLGDPEIYVHLAVHNSSTNKMEWTRCAGDGQTGAYLFDQNSNTWSDTVLVATPAAIQYKDFEFHVWEDDWGRCDGTNNLDPKADDNLLDDIQVAAAVASFAAAIQGVGPPVEKDYWELYQAVSLGAYILADGAIHDDYIGVTERLSPNCFATATGGTEFALLDEDANVTSAKIKLDDNFSDRVVCPLEVTINGYAQVYACNPGLELSGDYTTDVDYAQGSITYQWKEDSGMEGTSSTHTIQDETTGQRKLEVEVTSAGKTATDTKWVTISAPPQGEEEEICGH